jgi:hypothetical protein
MVDTGISYNFLSVAEEFIAHKPFTGPHADALRERIRQRARELLVHPDIRYMPAFKILDLLAALVNAASATAIEPQLRRHEALALLNAQISDASPLIRQFMLEAALERARYEPMMLDTNGVDAATRRTLTLTKRWRSMCDAHQSHTPLPPEWLAAVSAAVDQAIRAPAFSSYRQGPLLQLFADMLQTARRLHSEGKSLTQLQRALKPSSALWKRYALKATRYRKAEVTSLSSPPGTHVVTPHQLH